MESDVLPAPQWSYCMSDQLLIDRINKCIGIEIHNVNYVTNVSENSQRKTGFQGI